jgi:hypothetical protein
MRALASVLLLAAAATGVPPIVAAATAQDGELSARALAARAAEYVAAYQKAFAFLIADEHYVQQAAPSSDDARTARSGPPVPVRRTIRGEMFLAYLPADRRWVALHDVTDVDGERVAGRGNLRALLAVSPVQSVAGRLFRHNARYNIGGISRNFNEPTLALQVFDPLHQSRFEFRLGGRNSPDPPAPLAALTFRERGRPTLVRSLDGKPVFSTGELLVAPSTGTVHRSRIAFHHDSIDAELITTFAFDERLRLWLPSHFTERYTTDATTGRRAETVTGEATYSNYRRFEGRARVVTGER